MVKLMFKLNRAIKKLCSELRSKVFTVFPDSMNTVIGGFYFLRFICPAIVSPEGFGIVEGTDSDFGLQFSPPIFLIKKILPKKKKKKQYQRVPEEP